MYKVYVHTCPNNKKYVGITSQRIKIRWANGKGYSKQKHFYNAILKYGWNNIKHEILYDNLNKEDACKIEQELILKYKTNDRRYGYNNSIGGEYSRLGVKGLHYNQKDKNPARKKVLCVELEITFNTITEAKETLKVDVSAVTKCCKGKRKTAGGYHWQYKDAQ